MSGTIDEEVAVEVDAASKPVAFVWQGQHYPVHSIQVVGTPPTRWWEGQGERTYLRVASRGHLYELYFDHAQKQWILARRL